MTGERRAGGWRRPGSTGATDDRTPSTSRVPVEQVTGQHQVERRALHAKRPDDVHRRRAEHRPRVGEHRS